ncbi:tetratricopeptide repeat protein [Psychrobacter sp. FDAARGOS_221]|uniref:tetratricopeptide repeat protein n=1 Tax=Psychrobacter sp. FDAARGOS_221 TaxID=1975705 RepID=UPI000BB5587D|nr:sel1 repeat family protein [Psychrobacter sp. FDAARGOS_221]PNK61686.1 sel1 repeat family protein [Psychrobacter sp. FDAARGOS_221]
MNKQVSIKLLSSATLLALAATGCESLPNIPGSSSSTSSTVSTPTAQETQAAIAVSTGDHKDRYKQNELAADPLYKATDLSTNRLSGIPTPVVSVANNSYIPTVIIPKFENNPSDQLDVSLLDDFIDSISPNARHYPPNFKTPSDRYYAKEKLKELEEWLRPFAENENASYEVLLRAAKLNGMGRNLDLGSDYAVRGSTFIAKAIDRQPNSAEANFIYGMMLSEGGGFKEGKKYLLKAAEQSYKEAEQSIAQADLLGDNRPAALERLKRLQQKHPDDATIAKQIQIVESGKYYIWDLPAN